MKKMHSLSFKVPIFLSAIIFLTIVMVSSIIIKLSFDEVSNTAFAGFDSTVEGYADVIEMIIHEQLTLGKTLIQSRNLRHTFETDLTDEQYDISASVLSAFNKVNPYAINIGLVNDKGIVILDSVDKKLVGKDISTIHSHLYNQVKANSEEFFVDNALNQSSTTGGVALLIMGAFKDANGKPIGMLYINLDVAKISRDFVESLQLPKGTLLSFINENKKFVLSTEPTLIGKDMSMSTYGEVYASHDGILPNYIGPYGDKRSAAFTTVEAVPWKVIISRDNKEIYAKRLSNFTYEVNT